MNFRVQFLDRSGSVVAEWNAYALDVAGAIALTERVHWLDGVGACEFSTTAGAWFTSGAGRPIGKNNIPLAPGVLRSSGPVR